MSVDKKMATGGGWEGCKAKSLGGGSYVCGDCCMDDENIVDETATWAILGAVSGIIIAIVLALFICFYWQRHSNNFRALLLGFPFLRLIYMEHPFPRQYLVTRKDSLDDLEDEHRVTDPGKLPQRRRRERSHDVIGIKSERIITISGTSGYRWKKKWRDRKARSKAKRKQKNEERKKRRAQRAAREQEEAEEDSESDESDSESSSQT